MNKIVLYAILVTYIVAQIPNCHILPGQDDSNVILMPQEVQVFRLQQFVQGFNLRFQAYAADETSFEIIDPFYPTDVRSFPETVNDNFTIIDFNLETDGNLAWIENGAFLASKNSDNSIFVATGKLNQDMNIVINNTIGIATAGNTTCFNVITLSEDHTLVDCQQKQKQTDILYIIDQNNIISPYPFQNSVLTQERKSVPLRLVGDRAQGDLKGGRVFILSAWIGSGMQDQSQVNNTKIEVYYLNKFVPQKATTFIAQHFSVDDLSISDITVDALGYIYVSDIRGIVFQCTFDGDKLNLLNTWNFNEKIFKISADVTNAFINILQAVGETQIFEVDFDKYSSKFTYQLPQNQTKIVDFVTNNDLLVVQTQSYYFVYKRYFTQLDNIIAAFTSNNSRVILSPRSPNSVFIDINGTTSYLHSEGFFIVKNPIDSINQTVTILAQSKGYNNYPSKTCQLQFKVKSVTDQTQLYYLDDMPSIISLMSSDVTLDYELNDYFLGTRLKYEVNNDTDVDVTLLTKGNIRVTSNQSFDHADWLTTFEDSYYSYYKLLIVDQKMIVQLCIFYSEELIECSTVRKQDFTDKIFKYSIYKTVVDAKTTIPVLAYISDNNRRSINFVSLTSDRTFSPLVVHDIFNATDIDFNARYLYVSIKDAKMIKVYKNDFNLTFDYLDSIDQSTILSQDPDFIFYPSETMLSETDLNVLIVKNIDGILIFRVTAFQIEYVSQISVPHLEFSYIQSEIVVGQDTLLVMISSNSTDTDDEIHEYSIYDLSKPFKLRSINLIDKKLSRDVTVYTTKSSQLVGLRTNFNGTEYLTVIQRDRPQVGSVLDDIPIQGNLLSIVKVSDFVIGQTISKTQQGGNIKKHINNQITITKFYESPSLIVKAHLKNNNFKDTQKFQLVITSLQKPVQLTQIINLYNVKSTVSPSQTQPKQISFPKNSNGGTQTLQVPLDDYFLGPVCKLSISCPICKDSAAPSDNNASITLQDHVTLLSEAEFANARGFYYFTDNNTLWTVTNEGIYVTDSNLKQLNYVQINFGFNSVRVDGIAPFGNKFIIYAYNEEDNLNNLVIVTADDKFNPFVQIVAPIYNNPGINAVQLIKSIGNRVFILDNKLDTSGKGQVFVITYDNSDGAHKFTYQFTIDSLTFDLTSGKINDFELIDLSDNKGFFLASLSDYGIVFGSFETTSNPFYLSPNSYSFNGDNNIQDYQISGLSSYLQLEIISQQVQSAYLHLTTLLTVSYGQHLEFFLNFNKNDNSFVFDSINIIGQFDKYGKQNVINWAQGLVYEPAHDNFILIGHKNSFEIALGVYPLTHQSSEIGHERMIGAVQTPTSKPQIRNDFTALLFRVKNQMRVVVSGMGSPPSVQLFNLSKNVFLTYNYDQKQNFSQIKVSASNAYGSTARMIQVSFESNPVPHEGMAWYIILVIVLGILAIVGIGVFLFIRYKKKQSISKDSLISLSKGEEEDEEI